MLLEIGMFVRMIVIGFIVLVGFIHILSCGSLQSGGWIFELIFLSKVFAQGYRFSLITTFHKSLLRHHYIADLARVLIVSRSNKIHWLVAFYSILHDGICYQFQDQAIYASCILLSNRSNLHHIVSLKYDPVLNQVPKYFFQICLSFFLINGIHIDRFERRVVLCEGIKQLSWRNWSFKVLLSSNLVRNDPRVDSLQITDPLDVVLAKWVDYWFFSLFFYSGCGWVVAVWWVLSIVLLIECFLLLIYFEPLFLHKEC